MTAASVPLKIVMSELMAPRARCNANNAGTSERSMPVRQQSAIRLSVLSSCVEMITPSFTGAQHWVPCRC